MPYNSNADLPEPVRNALPAEAQDIYRAAFNAALKADDDERQAAIAGWAAVKNAGWKKDEDFGKWTKAEKRAWLEKREKQRYTLGVVYEPNVVDTQGDFAEADEIEKACWNFMRKLQGKTGLTKTALSLLEAIVKSIDAGEAVRVDVTEAWDEIQKAGLNDMHINTPDDENLGEIVECYTAPVDFDVGKERVTKGTWLMGVVWSPEHFELVEEGKRTGYSMEGRARSEEVKSIAQ